MILLNSKEVRPVLNGQNLSRVLYNGKQIYPNPSAEGISPDEAPNGVYVYSNDGKLYEPSSWDTSLNDSALGVAVVTDNCRFAISKELPMVNNIQWSSALYGTDVDGVLTTTSQNTAITDYAGQNNTKLIRNAAPGEDSSNNAAHYCYEQTLNEEHGYLPAAGELAAIHNNKSDIDEVLVLIGSKSISDRCDEFQTQYSNNWLWSSTERSDTISWYLFWEYSSLGFSTSSKGYSGSNLYAFPFFPFPSNQKENIGISPDDASNGVYVYSNDGKLYDKENWSTSNNDNALGVAIIKDDVKFAISKSLPMINSIYWGIYRVDVQGLNNYPDSSSAKTDFNGKYNTDTIISSLVDSDAMAAGYCAKQNLEGKSGYLPSAGELYIMWENYNDINDILQLLGSKTIDEALTDLYDGNHYLWSSTEYSSEGSWFLNWDPSATPLTNFNKSSENPYFYAFPVFPIYSYPTLYISQNINRPFTYQEFHEFVDPYGSQVYKLIIDDLVDSEMQVISDYYCRMGDGAADEPFLVLKSNSVVSTPESFIYGTSNIRGLDFSGMSSLTTIQNGIASGQMSLLSLKFPDSLQTISEFSFQSCDKLKEVVIPDSVTFIGDDCFNGCTGLERLVIGSGVETISSGAFGNCPSLTDISFYGASEPEYYGSSFSNVSASVKVQKDYSGSSFCGLSIEKVLD